MREWNCLLADTEYGWEGIFGVVSATERARDATLTFTLETYCVARGRIGGYEFAGFSGDGGKSLCCLKLGGEEVIKVALERIPRESIAEIASRNVQSRTKDGMIWLEIDYGKIADEVNALFEAQIPAIERARDEKWKAEFKRQVEKRRKLREYYIAKLLEKGDKIIKEGKQDGPDKKTKTV